MPDLDHLRALVTPETKLIALTNPNNPTGALIERPMLEDIVSIADSVGAYLLCDEVYRGTGQKGDGMVPSIADLYDKGISTAGMSKVFLAGGPAYWLGGGTQRTHRRHSDTSRLRHHIGRHDQRSLCCHGLGKCGTDIGAKSAHYAGKSRGS